MAPRRIRTHTNPLQRFPELTPPVWSDVFADPGLPLVLELGAANGEFLLDYARAEGGKNILGVEIRKPLVMDVRERINRANLRNAWILYGNIAGRIKEFTPAGVISEVVIFFPDPWPKNRHHKRRVINAALLDELASLMPPHSPVHVMTDHDGLRGDIAKVFMDSPHFRRVEARNLVVKSHWQKHCEATGRPFERFTFLRSP